MLSQTVGYAVLALGYLAKVQEPTFVRDIATATAIPGPYLAKLINQLARKGLVTTQRGLRGGVTLGRPASEITLMELCEALDEPVVQKRCLLDWRSARRSKPVQRTSSGPRSERPFSTFLVGPRLPTSLASPARLAPLKAPVPWLLCARGQPSNQA